MKLVDEVFEICESFMKNPQHVYIDYEKIRFVSNGIKLSKKPVFPIPKEDNILKATILELVAASVNYCYWYGKSSIRPNGANSTRMYELLINSFYDFEYITNTNFETCIDRFKRLLSINRFPLIEERVSHLEELQNCKAINFCTDILARGKLGIEPFLNELVENFPGFSSDIFLKRASLFFIQLNRRFGWYKEELSSLHVPADYQIPKMLHHYYIIGYSDSLQNKIDNNILIPKNSLEECEIRAATILSIKKICDLTSWNVADVDSYFFLNRNITNDPFHLTITTDY